MSEPETSRPVEKRNFYLPRLHLALPSGVIPSEFRIDLLHCKSLDYRAALVLRSYV